MTLTNCYATLAQVYADLAITSTDYDDKLEMAINAASRQIDKHCGRPHGFWQDSALTTRTYDAESSTCCDIPDEISTTTGLIVKVDSGDDGTFATTLTLNTDFLLLPRNAAYEVPVQPWDELRIIGGSSAYFPRSSSGRPGVQVTAKFGWPAVPDDVTKACIIQAVVLFKSSEAPFGAVQLGFDQSGVQRMSAKLHPVAAGLLEPYVKVYA